MPAMAAARGVFKRARIKSVSCSRAILLKVLDDISHCRKPVNATNPVLSAFNTKQVADGSMGLDETQNDSRLVSSV
jgi:hypothetical protein